MKTKLHIIALLMLTLPVAVFGQASGNAAYREGDYRRALSLYENDLADGVSADIYYNMGNAYYRTGQYANAMLCYKRAQRLRPASSDIAHNINVTVGKTADKMPVYEPVFFVRWYKALMMSLTIDEWGYAAIISLSASLLLFLLFLFTPSIAVKKVGLYSSVALMLAFLTATLMAWQQKRVFENHDEAVAIAPTVTVKTSPGTASPTACVIHEGTILTITDNEIKGWYGIRLSDGREGWVADGQIELI